MQQEATKNFFRGSLSPLSKCLKWNKGNRDVVLCRFEVTVRLYSHEPAPLRRRCNTAGIQNKPEKTLWCLRLLCPCETKVWNFAAAHLTWYCNVDSSSCHVVWDLKLISILLQGGLCSVIYEIELASSFCSCSVITCTAAGEKALCNLAVWQWAFDRNPLGKKKTPLQCLF